MQISLLNGTILNVFQNHLPSKYITVNDKDPAWINENIKLKIKTKTCSTNNIYRIVDLKVTLCFLKFL